MLKISVIDGFGAENLELSAMGYLIFTICYKNLHKCVRAVMYCLYSGRILRDEEDYSDW